MPDRLHCTQPVSPTTPARPTTAWSRRGNSFIIENNYGYGGPTSTILGKTTTPGMARVMVDGRLPRRLDQQLDRARARWRRRRWATACSTRTRSRPSTRSTQWYFTAIDIRTGRTVWSRLTGTGIQWNNHYAAIYLGPDGAAYIATLAGLVRIQDG